MKSTSISTVFIAILLTNLVHIALSQPYSLSDFDDFLQRLVSSIETSSPDVFPFMVKSNLVTNLEQTSNELKELCIVHDVEALHEDGQYSPVSSLLESIEYVFYEYKESLTDYNDIRILSEIQSVDPIGLIVYLTQSNEDKCSPTFMQSVVEFRKYRYKTVPITAGGKYYISDFLKFVQRFKKVIDSSSSILPFTLQIRVIASLWHTSNEFKELCIRYDVDSKRKNGDFSPISSLNRTINRIFRDYKNGVNGNGNILYMLQEIQQMDPIGLHVYLSKKMESESSPTFMESIQEFQATMYARLRLVTSKVDNSYINIFAENPQRTLYYIPDDIRTEITTEYKAFNRATIDLFIEIAREQFPHINMYSTAAYHTIENFQPHNSKRTNDIQILFSDELNSKAAGHAFCIYYEGFSRKVFIYDSVMNKELNEKQQEIIARLYPFNKEVVPKKPKSLQGRTQTCALFAITYATMLLLHKNPVEYEINLNHVYGEEGLYMRLHILDMMANRRLALWN